MLLYGYVGAKMSQQAAEMGVAACVLVFLMEHFSSERLQQPLDHDVFVHFQSITLQEMKTASERP